MSTDSILELWEQELRHGHFRLRDADGAKAVEVEGLLLTSRFQPILSRAHGRPVGHRGQVHVHDARLTDPVAARAELQRRDRSGRTAALEAGLHMTNYRLQHRTSPPGDGGIRDRGWLFVPVPPPVLPRPGLWPPLPQDLFASDGYAPKDIVLEVPMDAAGSGQIADFTRYHQALGFMVALTDFGRPHMDLSAIWQIQPDLVTLALRALGAVASRNATRTLAALCRLLHESGSMVCIGGIDSEADLARALATETDLLEGSWAHRAGLAQAPAGASDADGDDRELLAHCVDAITSGHTFESACEALLGRPGVLRCYLLDGAGTQLADNLSPVGIRSDPRFWPLANAVGASWAHRDYFRAALAHPGQVMRTGPYFSLPDGRHCVTLSMAGREGDRTLVLCCDLAESASD